MVLNEKQWQDLCCAIETRGYRYFDDEDEYSGSDEMKMFLSVQKQVLKNKIKVNGKPSALRFSAEKKEFLVDLLQERINTESESRMASAEYIENLNQVLRLLTKRRD